MCNIHIVQMVQVAHYFFHDHLHGVYRKNFVGGRALEEAHIGAKKTQCQAKVFAVQSRRLEMVTYSGKISRGKSSPVSCFVELPDGLKDFKFR